MASNRVNSKTRSQVEHVFGARAQMGGNLVHTIGTARARVKIAMMNLAYNMRRFVLLCQREIHDPSTFERSGGSAAV